MGTYVTRECVGPQFRSLEGLFKVARDIPVVVDGDEEFLGIAGVIAQVVGFPEALIRQQ